MDERLKQQLYFILEIDKEKNILRQTHLSGHGRRENDAEHAWHMAIMAYLLKDYANEPVDIAKVMIMCLIHDIVEIDAADLFTEIFMHSCQSSSPPVSVKFLSLRGRATFFVFVKLWEVSCEPVSFPADQFVQSA